MIRLNVHKHKLHIAAATLLVFVGVSVTPQVLAEELSISGNGAESKSEIKTNTSSDTTVQQNNNASVNNDVNVDANTGDNDANKNTDGDVSITTGDVNSSTSVNNSVNTSKVNITNCDNCGGSGSVTISGNGAFSDNKIKLNTSSDIDVSVNQRAWVKNDIYEDLNTGKNDANLNTDGDVSIDTGDIRSRTNLFNLLNLSDISIAGSPFHDFLVKIFGNGAFSDNDAKLKFDNDKNVDVDNSARVINELKHRYETGNNDANKNTGGDVSVETGDIDAEVNVKNVANISKVDITCECVTPTPTNAPAPTTTPAPTNAPTSAPTTAPTSAPAAAAVTSTPSPERVLGAAAVLPVTGSNLFFFMLLANVVMFLTGAYLRLRSGRSPGAMSL